MNTPPDSRASRTSKFRMMNRISQVCFAAVTWVLVWAAVRTLVPFETLRGYLDQRAGDGSADTYTPELHRRVVASVGTAIWLALAAGVTVWSYRKELRDWQRSNFHQAFDLLLSLGRSLNECRIPILVSCTVALVLRWPYWHLPIRFDEAYTWLNYASSPLYITVSRYDSPNNHVFHSLMVWISSRLFGDTEAVIRLPSLLCGIGTAGVTAWWASRRSGAWSGLAAGLFVASSSILIEYSVNARGYTLSHLLLMTLWLFRDEWQQRPTRIVLVGMSILAGLALWAIPISLYGLIVLGVEAWLSTGTLAKGERRAQRIALSATAAGTSALTVLLYLPVLIVWGPSSITSSGQGSTHGFIDWGTQLLSSGKLTAGLWFRDTPLLFAVFLVLAAISTTWSRSMPTRTMARGVAFGLLVCVFVVTLQGVVPPPRTWLFVLPLLGVLASTGVLELFRTWRTAWLLALFAAFAVSPLMMWRHHTIEQSQEGAPCLAAESIIRELSTQIVADEPIIAVTPTSAPLAFYARRQGLSERHFFPPGPGAGTRPAWIVVSRKPDQTVSSVLKALNLQAIYGHNELQLHSEWPDARVYRIIPR